MAWDKELIAEGVPAPDLNDEIRANWAALEDALNKETYFSTGGEASLQGILKQGGARCFFQATAPATRVDGSAFAATDLGLLWVDSNSSPVNQLNILTAITPTWTPVSVEIIAALLAAARQFAEVVTFDKSPVLSKAPTLTEGIVANATYLQGRNEADDDNTDMIQVGRNEADDTDVAQVPDLARLASNAAPTEDTQIPNKKYVDDNVGAAQMKADNVAGATFGSGTESCTLANGLIIKAGSIATSGTSGTVTFGTAFPGGITSVVINETGNYDHSENAATYSVSAAGFSWRLPNAQSDLYWIAIGY